MHPDGYVEIKDRSKDIIISGGENISTDRGRGRALPPPRRARGRRRRPARRALGRDALRLRHAEGRRHRDAEPRSSPSAANTSPASRRPGHVVFGPLPKTSTGKIQKFVLRDKAKAVERAGRREVGVAVPGGSHANRPPPSGGRPAKHSGSSHVLKHVLTRCKVSYSPGCFRITVPWVYAIAQCLYISHNGLFLRRCQPVVPDDKSSRVGKFRLRPAVVRQCFLFRGINDPIVTLEFWRHACCRNEPGSRGS